MSEQTSTLVDKLIHEMYRAIYEDEPMDNRRLKRLMRLDGNFAETINKGAVAYMNSRTVRQQRRREKRK